jgi:hypothetical protein
MIKVNVKQAQGDLEHLVDEADTVRPGVIGNSLDHFIGIWSAEEADEFLKAIEVFEEVDESFWS